MKNLTFLTAILIASLSFAQVPTYVPTTGLVGWWPFNGNANDESGNGNNGTVNGATLTTDRNGVVNKAYSFTGIDDYINCGNNLNLEMSTGISVSLWLNTSQIPIGEWECLLNKEGEYEIGINNQGKLIFAISNGTPGWNEQITSISPTIGYWTNFIITYDQNYINIYINGVSVFVISGSGLVVDYIDHINQDDLFFGWRQHFLTDNLSRDFNGSLDDIGIWNRALTDCEIKDLYNSQLGSGNTLSSQTQTALDTYTWPVNNQTYTQSGTYSDTLVNAAGCDSIVSLNLTLSYTGINELSTSIIAISPNPTNGDFTLSGLELFNTISSMIIKDVNGKTIKELDPKTAKFSLGTVKAGVYFLTIIAGNKQEVVKIIKE
jgi:hypothetical protein